MIKGGLSSFGGKCYGRRHYSPLPSPWHLHWNRNSLSTQALSVFIHVSSPSILNTVSNKQYMFDTHFKNQYVEIYR